MRKIKTLVFVKIFLLIGAMILAGFLIFVNKSPTPVEESTIIIMDVGSDMLTQDILTTTANDFITRLDAAKKIVTKIIAESPQRSFGLITYGSQIDYLIPPTTDSGTLLQYASSLVTRMKNEEVRSKNFGVWSTGLIAALQGKNIVVLGNVALPKSLEKNAQIIPLATYKNFQPVNSLTFEHVNLSTSQTQWLIIILCLLVILSL
ncbi:MAG: VWA domain-containing protein [candidate division SR1 bacterium]|nr:VWA domain-containing protein [candidate division SR1 bacterium]